MRLASEGLSIVCDEDGVLLEILRDDQGLLGGFGPGTRFPSIVERDSLARALDFIMEIRNTGAAFDREFRLITTDAPEVLHFSGGRVGGAVFMAGSPTKTGIMDLFEDLVTLNAESLAEIRRISKGNASLAPPSPAPVAGQSAPGPDEACFDELSRLNNELVDAQRRLAKQNAELERLAELKNRFLGMAAHDLRGPLAVIMSMCEVLSDPDFPPTPDQVTEFAGTASGQATFILALVDDLLDSAALEAGSLKLELVEADVTVLVAGSVHAARTLAARKVVGIDFSPGASGLVARLDPIRITQLLNNLISNAVKFSKPGSMVGVSVGREDGFVRVVVEDRGVGMEKSELERLFLPFGAVSHRGTVGEKSTGLGLYIARRIAEAHGGSLNLESVLGSGTVATFLLPLLGVAKGGQG